MNLSHHLDAIRNTTALKQALQGLSKGKPQTLVDMPEATRAVIAAAVATGLGGRTLVLASRRDRADALHAALSEYLPPGTSLERWYAPDALPYEQLPVDIESSVQRTRIMAGMLAKNDGPSVVVAPVGALTQLLMSPSELLQHSLEIRVGAHMRIDAIVKWATEVGYQTNPMVQEPGSVAPTGRDRRHLPARVRRADPDRLLWRRSGDGAALQPTYPALDEPPEAGSPASLTGDPELAAAGDRRTARRSGHVESPSGSARRVDPHGGPYPARASSRPRWISSPAILRQPVPPFSITSPTPPRSWSTSRQA